MAIGFTMAILALIVKHTLETQTPGLSLGIVMPIGAWGLVTAVLLMIFDESRPASERGNRKWFAAWGIFCLFLGFIVYYFDFGSWGMLTLYGFVGAPIGAGMLIIAHDG